MNYRDNQIVQHINKHYNELCEEMRDIKSFEDYINPANNVLRKAILIDILQIGENITHFSKESSNQINQSDLKGIVDIRNIVVHGYAIIKDKIIYNSVVQDLPRLINEINNIK